MLEKLIALDKLGIPQVLLAQYCHCHKSMISKLVRKEVHLTEKTSFLIEEGLEHFFNDIKNIIE